MRVIIACAGPQDKWAGHLGVPSHLVPVGGEPLLHRTVRQALTLTGDVHVTAPPDERYDVPGAVRHCPGDHPNEYAASRSLWSVKGRTVLMLGDVYFTDAAVRTIGAWGRREYRVFGRRGASHITGTPYGEIFACSWWPQQHPVMDEHLARIGGMTKAGWRLLRLMQGTPLDRHVVRARHFTNINDATDDFDRPDDYARHPATPAPAGVATTLGALPGLLAEHGIAPRGIVHVGAHQGQEVPLYKDAGFARIVLVEPNPHLAAGLRALDGVEVIEGACADTAGTGTLHITAHDKLSSLHRPAGRPVVETVPVRVHRLADLIDATVNVAVIDAQGAELEVVAGAPLDILDLVVAETFVRPKRGGAPGYAETVETMARLGWRVAAEWPYEPKGRGVDVAFVKAAD